MRFCRDVEVDVFAERHVRELFLPILDVKAEEDQKTDERMTLLKRKNLMLALMTLEQLHSMVGGVKTQRKIFERKRFDVSPTTNVTQESADFSWRDGLSVCR